MQNGYHFSADTMIYDLIGSSLVLAEDWERLSHEDRELVCKQTDRDRTLNLMIECGLLTQYQAARIAVNNTFGLVLGNFRILERLGAGGMAVVYKAEHIEMRHLVAIKVLQLNRGDDPRLETRFSAEMRAVACLRHPNIVTAMDAGRAYSPDPEAPVLWYLVMEYVPGENLDEHVRARGALPIAKTCNLIHQIASALHETHKLHLVHRDIKPSNIIITPEEQAKLLDFGLSRHISTRQTQPGTILGTIDFMAPEQARDSSQVDIRADIYSLGGTLFWALTGELPFSTSGSETEILIRRLSQQPPSLRSVAPSMPLELDRVIHRMMALNPGDRYSTPADVMQALLPFLHPATTLGEPGFEIRDASLSAPHGVRNTGKLGQIRGAKQHRVLIIDDEPGIRLFCKEMLAIESIKTEQAGDIEEGFQKAASAQPDLVLLDINMPGGSGLELLRRLKANPPVANLKIIMFSGMASADELAEMLLAGADDYLTKPLSVPQFLGRVRAALRLKDAQDRSDNMLQHLLVTNTHLERGLSDRTSDLTQVRSALVLGLARLAQLRENDQNHHLERMARFCTVLAEAASRVPGFGTQIDESFIDMLSCCAPLHDIGKVGLPDHILFNPGKLQSDERILMQAHTTMPAEMLSELSHTHGSARAFLQMAADIIRHHHERYDGTGYPDRLMGNAIPLSARIVTIADVYDALRSRRSYKPALSHAAAAQLMSASVGQFDPALLEVFKNCEQEFERIYRELPN